MERMVEIGLTGLTHILKGGVRIEKNRMLCFVNTISWESIVTEKYHQNIHIEVRTRFKKILDREFYNFKHFLNLINILYFIGAQCL